MKKVLIAFLTFLMIIPIASCSLKKDSPVLASLGKYRSSECFSGGSVQDFIYYNKYFYDEADLSDNKYLKKVSDDGKTELLSYIEEFEAFLEAIEISDEKDEVVLNYDFDKSLITDGDYLYISDDSEYKDKSNFDIYFFDTESKTLYYFHANV